MATRRLLVEEDDDADDEGMENAAAKVKMISGTRADDDGKNEGSSTPKPISLVVSLAKHILS